MQKLIKGLSGILKGIKVPVHRILGKINRSWINFICMTEWLNCTNIVKAKSCICMFMGQNNLQQI